MSLSGRCFPTIVVFVLLGLNWATAMAAEEPPSYTTGLRGGTSLRGEDTQQLDIFFTRNLPWTKALASGWKLESSGELTASALHHEDEDGLSASISTDLILLSPTHRVAMSSGVGAGLLEDYMLGDYDFGGPIFFLFHAGAWLQLTPRISLGYRYSHQSNGHIYIKNPSLNVHQLELRFSF